MKILLVSGSYPPLRCGVGDYTARLANALASVSGVTVEVLTSGDQMTPEQIDGVTVWRNMASWTLRRWLDIVRRISASRPDYVHVQYPTQGYRDGHLPAIIPLMAWLLGAKVVQTWHEPCGLRPRVDLFLKSIVPGRVVVVRPHYRKRCLHPLLDKLLPRGRFVYIPNASVIPKADLSPTDAETVRRTYLRGQQRLVVFFGFVLPNKGAERVFDIAEPSTDYVVIAGAIGDARSGGLVADRIAQAAWRNRAEMLGFLPVEQAAVLLAVADAVVLPFRAGGGEWNTSIHAATLQGTFVLTTASVSRGYSEVDNTYFADPGDLDEMRRALATYAGRRQLMPRVVSWDSIANDHVVVYSSIGGRGSES